MLVNIIQNTISSFISAGISVITTNLKMWLGFETSLANQEQVVDGDFPTGTTAWQLINGATISGNKANIIGDGSTFTNIKQTGVFKNGRIYKVVIDVTITSGLGLKFQDGANNENIGFATTTGIYTFNFTGTSNADLVVGRRTSGTAFDSNVNNISVKELTQITPDKSGNNNVGELFTGKALEFDGAGDNVGIAFTTPIKSAVFWVKPLSTGIENILSLGGAFGGSKYIRLNGNGIQTQGLSSVSIYVNGVQSSNAPLNQWSRVVVNFATVTPLELKFGYAFNSYGNIQLSDVQLYNENLSTDDIAYVYANPQNLVTDRTGTSIGLSNLKGYWHLSEGAGSLVYDSSGEGNNGTINGATYEPAQPRIPQLGMMNWSKGSNLFSYSQNFSLWNKEATVTLTPNYGTSPSGANDSTRMQMNANDSLYLDSLGSSKTFSIYVKGTQGETIRLSNGVGQAFTLTGNWDRIQLYDTLASSTLYSINTYSGATARDMEIWGGQLEDSSSASAYRLTDGGATLNSTVIPNPTIPTKDIFGNAVRDRLNSFNLDGSGYAEVADDTDLDFGTGAFTMESWVKADFLFQGSSINVALNLGGDTAGAGTAGIVSFSSNKLGGYVNAAVLEADSTFTQGNWYHVAITRNISGLCTLYIDSVAQTDTENAGGSVTNSNTKQIGRDTNLTRFYQNLISDVRLYDAELSATEVENNYNAGLSAHTN